jgi:hypothetical protein
MGGDGGSGGVRFCVVLTLFQRDLLLSGEKSESA